MAPSNSPFNLEWMFRFEQQYLNEVIFPEAERRMAQEPALRLLLAERHAAARHRRLGRRIQGHLDSARRASLHGLADLLTRSAERLREWAASHQAAQT
jgi:hypothetical protein